MLAFHSDPTLKSFVLAELQQHRADDKLVKGKPVTERWLKARAADADDPAAAARVASYKRQSDKLIELLKSA
jgi:hypothetical protein